MSALALTAIALGITYVLMPLIIGMIKKAGYLRSNFRQEQIPVATGLVFWTSVLLTGIIGYKLTFQTTGVVIYFVITAMTLLGLMDDLMGSREASGLKGHFIKLLKEKELTTGAFKALGGGLVAFVASVYFFSGDIPGVIVSTLIIALSTNAVNLLDLRPGRAAKGFLLGTLILFTAGFFAGTLNHPVILFLAMMTGSLLAYLPWDLKGRVMMGDAGSNPLGITLGLAAVIIFTPLEKYLYLGFLILLHLYTEKYSLTKTIENNKVLKFLDMLGRP